MIRKYLPFTNDDSDETPPKPDDYSDSRIVTLRYYEFDLHYRNGDVEQCGAYRTHRSDNWFRFKQDPRPIPRRGGGANISWGDARKVNYETLSREPDTKHIEDHRYQLTWDVEHELKHENKSWRDTVWEPNPKNLEIELEEQ